MIWLLLILAVGIVIWADDKPGGEWGAIALLAAIAFYAVGGGFMGIFVAVMAFLLAGTFTAYSVSIDATIDAGKFAVRKYWPEKDRRR